MKNLISIFSLYFVTSCASVSFYSSNNRFMIPENSGETLSGRIGLNYGSKSKVVLVENLTSANPTADHPEILMDDGLSTQAEVSLIPMIDVFYGSSGPGVKVQLLGSPSKTAKEGNLSLSMAIARETGSRSESEQFNIDPNSYKNEGKASYQITDIMGIIGYRKSDSALLYLNIAGKFMEASGTITKTTTTGTGSSATTESSVTGIPKQKGRDLSVLLGYQFSSESFYWLLEPGYSQVHWANADKRERFVFGTSLGFKW